MVPWCPRAHSPRVWPICGDHLYILDYFLLTFGQIISPLPPSSTTDMAGGKATETTPPGSHPHTTTLATTTGSIQPQSPSAFEACTHNYLQSAGPITTIPRPAAPRVSTAVIPCGSGHKTTITAEKSTIPTASSAPPSQPRFMRSNWTAQEVAQLDQLRSQGLPWSEVSTHFLGKTGNACRKRHERHKKNIQGRESVIERSNGVGVANPFQVSRHDSTTSTAATALTSSQAQIFASMLAPINYSNMTQAQILQMHNQFLDTVLEVPLLRHRGAVPPSFMQVNAQAVSSSFNVKSITYLP